MHKGLVTIASVLTCLIVPALVSGPFLPDLFLSIVSIICLILIFKKKKWFYLNNHFFIFFMVFYFYILLSSIFSENPLLSLESSLFYFRFALFCISIWFLINENDKFIKLFSIFLFFTAFFVSIDAIFQHFVGKNFFGMISPHSKRISGLFGNELILGSYLSRLIPLIVALFLFEFKNKKIYNLFFIIFILTVFFAIVLSSEKTALGLLLMSTFLICFGLNIRKKIKFLSLLIIICFVSISVFSNKVVKERVYKELILNADRGSYIFSRMHQGHYESGIQMFLTNKFFGHGPKMYRVLCNIYPYDSKVILSNTILFPKRLREKLEKEPGFKNKHSEAFQNTKGNLIDPDFYSELYYNLYRCSTHPHNTYIQFLAELGLVGMFFLIASFLFVAINYFKFLFNSQKIKHYDKRNYIACLLVCFILTLWPVAPTGNFFNNWLSIIYFLPVGFYLNAIQKDIDLVIDKKNF